MASESSNECNNLAGKIDHTLLEAEATTEMIDQLCEEALELELDPVLLQTGILTELDGRIHVDLVEIDRELLRLPVGDEPSPIFLDEMVRGVHPVQGLVGARFGMDEE